MEGYRDAGRIRDRRLLAASHSSIERKAARASRVGIILTIAGEHVLRSPWGREMIPRAIGTGSHRMTARAWRIISTLEFGIVRIKSTNLDPC